MRTKILLADDHKIIRDGLRSLIEKEPNMEVVAEACDAATTVQKAKELMPHILLSIFPCRTSTVLKQHSDHSEYAKYKNYRPIDALGSQICK